MSSSQGDQKNNTVLIVDDSELACESMKHTLSQVGLEVVALNSPFGFIRTVRESRPALILLDVGLGSVNGTKLVDLGRQHAPKGCPVVLYSSKPVDLLRQDAKGSGADGCVSKETTGQALINEVQSWLSRRKRD